MQPSIEQELSLLKDELTQLDTAFAACMQAIGITQEDLVKPVENIPAEVQEAMQAVTAEAKRTGAARAARVSATSGGSSATAGAGNRRKGVVRL